MVYSLIYPFIVSLHLNFYDAEIERVTCGVCCLSIGDYSRIIHCIADHYTMMYNTSLNV